MNKLNKCKGKSHIETYMEMPWEKGLILRDK